MLTQGFRIYNKPMATGTGNTLEEAEYSWFKQKNPSGVASNADLATVKRAYFVSQVGEQTRHENVLDLEKRWLRSLTGVTSRYPADMWREAVVGAGQTPANSIPENKFIYFKTVL